MFNVSRFHTDTLTQSITPLIHCSVNDDLMKATPFFNQSFFQMIDVADLATVDSLLQNPPNCLVHLIEIRAIRWPLHWTDEVCQKSLLRAVQQSRWHHGGLEHCPVGR